MTSINSIKLLSESGTADRLYNLYHYQIRYLYRNGTRTFYNKHPDEKGYNNFVKCYITDRRLRDIELKLVRFLRKSGSRAPFTLSCNYLIFDNDMREDKY